MDERTPRRPRHRTTPLRAALAVALLAAAPGAHADDATPVELEVGEKLNVCKAGLLVCPVSTAICDDPAVAVVEHGPEGAEVKGVSPGTTLCGMLGFERATRRVLRVTVKRPEQPPAGEGGQAQ